MDKRLKSNLQLQLQLHLAMLAVAERAMGVIWLLTGGGTARLVVLAGIRCNQGRLTPAVLNHGVQDDNCGFKCGFETKKALPLK